MIDALAKKRKDTGMDSLKLPEGVFSSQFSLRYSDVQAKGQLSLIAFLDYLQQTAGDHTESLGFGYREQLSQGTFWVLSRLSAEVSTWPQWPRTVQVNTWARGHKGLLALRDFSLTQNDEVFARASSAWVILKNKRPQRPENWTNIYQLVTPEPPFEESPPVLPLPVHRPEDWAQNLCYRTRSIESGWNDIDMNGHVNNRISVSWCLAAHRHDFLSTHQIQRLDVNFLGEILVDQTYNLCWEAPFPSEALVWNYALFPAGQTEPVLRVRITWRESRS